MPAAEGGKRQETGSRCTGRPGLYACMTVIAFCVGSWGSLVEDGPRPGRVPNGCPLRHGSDDHRGGGDSGDRELRWRQTRAMLVQDIAK